MHELTHLDLFSGIGGFALAASWARFQTVGFSEIDPNACKTLGSEWPEIRNYGDIRSADFSGCGPVTVLTGGFPCQPWSKAGKKHGARDDRHLWPAMLGSIKTVRPTWVIGENVPDLITLGAADGAIFDLENIGYACQPFVIPASGVGAGHERKRVWFIAHTSSQGRKGPVAHQRPSRGPCSTHPKPMHPIIGTWDELDRHSRGIRQGDGVSITMAREEIKGYGNAIVPQVVAPFFRWIAQIERGEIS